MMKKCIFTAVLMAFAVLSAQAQSGTNSPYSQFGLGELSDQTSGFNRGMNGLGLGFHEHNQVNFKNPASYSEIDSLSLIFDAGFSGQITNFKQGNRKLNANNADFEYVVGAFRLRKHLGISFGLLPLTNVGYSYSASEDVGDLSSTTSYNSYSGSGGYHQIYLGLGWMPFRHFSIGVNGAYIFGTTTRTVENSYSDSYANTLTKVYTTDVHSYRFNVGMQYTLPVSKKDEVTLGLTYTYGHKIGGKPHLQLISTNSTSGVADTTSFPASGEAELNIELPHEIGAGVMYNHQNKLKVGVDYELQKWSKAEYPVYAVNASNQSTYTMSSSYFQDRHKITAGFDYCPNIIGRKFLQRVHYRAGVSYATPYYYIDGNDGPKEISVSAGFGIPIINGYNNRSQLNISAQWVHRSATDYITENTFRLNIGLTFNERWFAKWKVN
jgi:hypothetical protein